MSDLPIVQLTAEQVTTLSELAEAENARLEDAASLVTQQAFNQGCFVGLLPGGIFLLVMYFVTGFSIIGAAIALVLIMTGLIAFANLAAMLARRNTIRRVYHEQSLGEIERALQDASLTRRQFDDIARQALPPHAALYGFLPVHPPPTAPEERLS